MLLLDHVTLAVYDLDDSVNRISNEIGIVFSPATETFPGARGQVARLGAGFLEVISIGDPSKIQSTPLGQGVSAYLSRKEGIFTVALEVRGGLSEFVESATARGIRFFGPVVQQVPLPNGFLLRFRMASLGFDMPWLIEYENTREWSNELKLAGIQVYVENLETAIARYVSAYNLSEADIETGTGEAKLYLDRGWIHLVQEQPIGFNTVILTNKETEYRIEFTQQQGIKIHKMNVTQ